MSHQESYTRSEARDAFETACGLVARAAQELSQAPERAEAGRAVRGALAPLDAARGAFELDDPARAVEHLAKALRDINQAREAAKRAQGPVGPVGTVDLAFDLLDQATSAIDRVTHRMRNATSCHSTFGAIRTPHSERSP